MSGPSICLFPIWRFGPVERYVRAMHREPELPGANLCGLRQQKATDSIGALLSMQHLSQEHIRDQMLLTTFDPDKRLVAAELEARWNEALQKIQDLENK